MTCGCCEPTYSASTRIAPVNLCLMSLAVKLPSPRKAALDASKQSDVDELGTPCAPLKYISMLLLSEELHSQPTQHPLRALHTLTTSQSSASRVTIAPPPFLIYLSCQRIPTTHSIHHARAISLRSKRMHRRDLSNSASMHGVPRSGQSTICHEHLPYLQAGHAPRRRSQMQLGSEEVIQQNTRHPGMHCTPTLSLSSD